MFYLLCGCILWQRVDGPSLLVQSLLYAVLLQGVVGPLSPVLVVAVMSRFRVSPEGRAGGLLVLSFIQRDRDRESRDVFGTAPVGDV